MKNNLLLLLMFAMIIVWSFTPQVYSMERRASAKKTSVTKEAPQIYKASGKITAFSTQNSTITISRNASSPLIISIDKNTLFYKGGKNVKSTEIKIGDFVAVTYEARKNLNMAKSIRVQDKVPAVTKK